MLPRLLSFTKEIFKLMFISCTTSLFRFVIFLKTRKHANNPRADVTRIPKQEYQCLLKKDSCSTSMGNGIKLMTQMEFRFVLWNQKTCHLLTFKIFGYLLFTLLFITLALLFIKSPDVVDCYHGQHILTTYCNWFLPFKTKPANCIRDPKEFCQHSISGAPPENSDTPRQIIAFISRNAFGQEQRERVYLNINGH